VPSELSWYSSTYTNDYKPAKARPRLISKGAMAPGWKLDVYNDDRPLSLEDLKGKVILLDFWIKNCGPCIKSVPHLNELQEKYKDRGVKIISINAADSKEDIRWFCTRYNTKYSVLMNGKEVTEKYGVSGFPTFVIIDKEGKVIYVNEGYDKSAQSAIEDVIEKAL
jgi:thiol-disulfide isomerase/thioredoxin